MSDGNGITENIHFLSEKVIFLFEQEWNYVHIFIFVIYIYGSVALALKNSVGEMKRRMKRRKKGEMLEKIKSRNRLYVYRKTNRVVK